MITEDKVSEIFCIADDFCKEFEAEMTKNALPSTADAPKRHRKRMLSDAERSASTSTLSVISSIIITDAFASLGNNCSRKHSHTTALSR